MAEGPVTISRFEERLGNLKTRWYFTKEELSNSPSRAHGVDPAKELSYRQQAANLIQDMGLRIGVNQLCTATAIVYMHRFFMVHSFKSFQRFTVATAALFLAAKVEEQPRKLEMVARMSYAFQNRDTKPPDPQSEVYKKLMEDISYSELLLLQTLGFEVAVEHPHQHVVKGTQLVGVSKDLSHTAYFMSHNSLLLTTFCLQYPPTVVACVCIHLACRWKGIEIPLSAAGKPWWGYIDDNVTLDQLNEYTGEFLKIYEMCPTKLQKKIMESVKMGQSKEKSGESSRSQASHSRPPDKTKAAVPHQSKPKPVPSSSQKPHKPSGAHAVPGSSSQPHRHNHSGKHTHHHPATTHSAATVSQSHSSHAVSAQNGSHSQTHNSTQESKHRPPNPATSVSRQPSKHHSHSRSQEEHHRHKLNSDPKHPSSQKHHSHHHHHPTVPGQHASAKPSDVANKHRLLASEHKHRPVSNHDNRPLKRPHPVDNQDVKRVKLETALPPLPAETTMLSLPPLPPPLPTEPPPDVVYGFDSPPPPPPPN